MNSSRRSPLPELLEQAKKNTCERTWKRFVPTCVQALFSFPLRCGNAKRKQSERAHEKIRTMLKLGLITGYFLQGQTRAERKQKFKHLKNLTLIHLTNFLSFRDIFVDRLAAHAMMKNTFYFVWFCRNWFATSHHNLLTFNAVYWHS